MFIVHDHREIPDIFSDPKDSRVDLAFMRRAPQFKGNIRIICDNITDASVCNTECLLLNDNLLHSIDGISCFKNSPLKVLSLSNNALESIPEEIALLKRITHLYMEDNKISDFPTVLFELHDLRCLQICGNRLCRLPEFPPSWNALEELYLDKCELSVIPESIALLCNLKVLIAGNNLLSNLPDSIASLKELEVLAVNSNQLTSIPNTLLLLPKLRILIANSNSIVSIPDDLADMHLEIVRLANNCIESVGEKCSEKWLHDENCDVLQGNPVKKA